MTDDHNIDVRVSADVGSFQRNMGQVNGELQKARQNFNQAGEAARANAKKIREMEEASKLVGQTFLAMGAGIALGVGVALKVVAEYGSALAEFQAITKASDAEVSQVGATAQRVGRQFGVTATDAVRAATALAKAGVSTSDVLGGALHGALVLSATDSISVAEAAETAAIAMTQFGLSGRDVGHIADLLAAGAAEAVGDVQDLSWALRQSGLVAAQFGLGIEETVGSLAAFASAGLIGSDAGTSFKQMLISIASPTGTARKEMEKYGLELYDAQGDFIGITALAGELQEKLGHLSQEQRQAALSIIFGQDAIRTATVLYNQGAEGMSAWIERVNQTGYAAELAEQRLDSLSGDIQKFNVSIQNAFINAGSGAADVLRGLVQFATMFTDALAAANPTVLNTGIALGGLTVAIGAVVVATTLGAPKVLAFRQAVELLGASGARAGKLVALAVKSIKLLSVAGAALVGLEIADQIVQNTGTSSEELAKSFDKVRSSAELLGSVKVQHMGLFGKIVDGGAGNTIKPFVKDMDEFKHGLDRMNDGFLNLESGDWGKILFGGFENFDMGGFTNGVTKLTDAMAGLVEGGNISMVTDQMKKLREEGLTIPEISQVIESSPRLVAALNGIGQEFGILMDPAERVRLLLGEIGPAAGESAPAVSELEKSLGDVGITAQGTIEKLEEFIDLLFEAGLRTQSVMEAEDDFTKSLHDVKDAVQQNIDKLAEKYIADGMGEEQAYAAAKAEVVHSKALEGNSKAAIANREMVYGLVDSFRAKIKTNAESGASEEVLRGKMRKSYDQMLDSITAITGNRQAAEKLTRELLGIPDDVNIDTWMSDAAKREAEALKRAQDLIDRNITIGVHTVYTKSGDDPAVARPKGWVARTGQPTFRALGGPVYGPGTETSDSIPAMLSKGEHVWTAGEVRAVGGQDAMYRLRMAARAGALPAYADGGEVSWAAKSATGLQYMPVAVGGGSNQSGGGAAAITANIYGVPMDMAQTAADKFLFALHNIQRGGVYASMTNWGEWND